MATKFKDPGTVVKTDKGTMTYGKINKEKGTQSQSFKRTPESSVYSKEQYDRIISSPDSTGRTQADVDRDVEAARQAAKQTDTGVQFGERPESAVAPEIQTMSPPPSIEPFKLPEIAPPKMPSIPPGMSAEEFGKGMAEAGKPVLEHLADVESIRGEEFKTGKERIQSELETRLGDLPDDVKQLFAPSFTRLQESEDRSVETARRITSAVGSARGTRAAEMELEIKDRAQQQREGLDTEARLRQQMLEAEARGGAAEEIDKLRTAYENAQTNTLGMQAQLAAAEKGMLEEAVRQGAMTQREAANIEAQINMSVFEQQMQTVRSLMGEEGATGRTAMQVGEQARQFDISQPLEERRVGVAERGAGVAERGVGVQEAGLATEQLAGIGLGVNPLTGEVTETLDKAKTDAYLTNLVAETDLTEERANEIRDAIANPELDLQLIDKGDGNVSAIWSNPKTGLIEIQTLAGAGTTPRPVGGGVGGTGLGDSGYDPELASVYEKLLAADASGDTEEYRAVLKAFAHKGDARVLETGAANYFVETYPEGEGETELGGGGFQGISSGSLIDVMKGTGEKKSLGDIEKEIQAKNQEILQKQKQNALSNLSF